MGFCTWCPHFMSRTVFVNIYYYYLLTGACKERRRREMLSFTYDWSASQDLLIVPVRQDQTINDYIFLYLQITLNFSSQS